MNTGRSSGEESVRDVDRNALGALGLGLTTRRPPSAAPAAVPRNPQIQYHLGVVYTGHGRNGKALE
jgi:hypothetical protein